MRYFVLVCGLLVGCDAVNVDTPPAASPPAAPPPVVDLPTIVDPPADSPDDSNEAPGDVAEVYVRHNQIRTAANRWQLERSQALAMAAQRHAEWMAANSTMSHTGENGSSFWDRARKAGYSGHSGGENIAAGQRNVDAVMQSWMNSPGHRQNIMGVWKYIGCGMAESRGKRYWCVVFGG